MAAPDDSGQSPVVRQTQYGPIEGVDDAVRSGTYYWLGVPYAKPPVGDLRWRAPMDPDRWTTLLPTKVFGNACVQFGALISPGRNNSFDRTIGETLDQVVGSEDCLYLNIWRPASHDSNLPVIVFIHGGFNLAGYTADPVYDGAKLAKTANAVVVTANYRLNVFGWFSLPQLKTGNAEEDSGNFGTLDTVKALQWVRRNISEFGGDASNVTLMGQSAGAWNTWVLMVAAPTRAAGLFHRIAPLSGGMSLASNLPAGAMPALQPAPYFAAQGKALFHNLLIADGKAADEASASAFVERQSSAQIADYMRGQSPSAILQTFFTKLVPVGLGAAGPIPDGVVLPLDPIAAMAAGNCAKVPVLASNTRDETKLVANLLALSPALGGVPGFKVSNAELFRTLFDFDPNGATSLTSASLLNEKYLPVDTPGTGYNAKTALLTSLWPISNRDNVLNTLKMQQPNIWYYRFDWAREPAPWDDVYGAAHMFDLPFVFGNFGPSLFGNAIGGDANERGRVALSEAMMASIAAFARNGDPNNASLGVRWPTWPKTLVFDATLTDKTIRVE